MLTCRKEPEDLPPFIRILPVTLHGPNTSVDTYALLDEGSAITLLDESLSKHLKLNGPTTNQNVHGIGQQATSEQSQLVQLQISGSSQRKFVLKGIRTIKNINLPSQSFSLSHLDQSLRHLPVAEYCNAVPMILIGLDNCRLEFARNTRVSGYGGPIVVQTILGWFVHRPQPSSPAYVLHLADTDRWKHLDQIIKEFMTTESFGTKHPDTVQLPGSKRDYCGEKRTSYYPIVLIWLVSGCRVSKGK